MILITQLVYSIDFLPCALFRLNCCWFHLSQSCVRCLCLYIGVCMRARAHVCMYDMWSVSVCVICLELLFRFAVPYDKAVVARLSGYLLQQLDNTYLVADVNRVMCEQRDLVNCHFRKRQVILKNTEICASRCRLRDTVVIVSVIVLCQASKLL